MALAIDERLRYLVFTSVMAAVVLIHNNSDLAAKHAETMERSGKDGGADLDEDKPSECARRENQDQGCDDDDDDDGDGDSDGDGDGADVDGEVAAEMCDGDGDGSVSASSAGMRLVGDEAEKPARAESRMARDDEESMKETSNEAS